MTYPPPPPLIPLAAWRAAVDLQRHINTIKEPHMPTPTVTDHALDACLAAISTADARTIAARLISKADAADAAAKEAEEAAAKARERADLTKPGTFLIAKDGATFYVETAEKIWRLMGNALFADLAYWERQGFVLTPIKRSYSGERLDVNNPCVVVRDPETRAAYYRPWEL